MEHHVVLSALAILLCASVIGRPGEGLEGGVCRHGPAVRHRVCETGPDQIRGPLQHAIHSRRQPVRVAARRDAAQPDAIEGGRRVRPGRLVRRETDPVLDDEEQDGLVARVRDPARWDRPAATDLRRSRQRRSVLPAQWADLLLFKPDWDPERVRDAAGRVVTRDGCRRFERAADLVLPQW